MIIKGDTRIVLVSIEASTGVWELGLKVHGLEFRSESFQFRV